MNADPQLRDRLRSADDAARFDLEATLSAVRDGVEARHRRRRVETFVVVAAIVGLLAFAGWRAAISGRPTIVPIEPPTPSSSPQDDRVRITPPPPGIHAELTVEAVERFVLDQIAADEATLGGSVKAARIISVRYVSPGEQVGPETYRHASWLVKYEGTRLNCTSWCSVHPGGTIQFSDKGPDALGGAEVLEDPVCVAHRLGTGPPPPGTNIYPPCKQILEVTNGT